MTPRALAACGLALLLGAAGAAVAEEPRPRLRDLGVEPGILPPGPLNAITDVEGVLVGHRTLVRGEGVRTGVTAILPHGGNLFRDKVAAAVHVANAFGKAAGLLQVQELGTLETPIVLTNTLGVGAAVTGVVAWTLEQEGNEAVRSVNAVVGETNDGYLNDIRRFRVRPEDVRGAIQAARWGPVAEGSVGAGTGTRLFGWKGGIGTASRRLPDGLGGHTVGALVQTNFDGILSLDGVPVGRLLGRYDLREALEGGSGGAAGEPEGGSVMIVLATDAPLAPSSLERLAQRAVLALGRVGSYIRHGSGDFVIAFSTVRGEAVAPPVEGDDLNPLFLATVESVEEAIYNSLLRATTMTGYRGRTVEAIPIDRLREVLAEHGRAAPGER